MDSQLFDQFLEDGWSAEPCDSKPVNTGSDLNPNYMWLNQYDPLAFNFEDLQSIDQLESCALSDTSSPLEFSLPSPISDASSLTVDERFDQKLFIDPWTIPTAFETNSPASENFLAISTPSSSSFPGNSECSSPRDDERDVRPKKPTTRAAKHHHSKTSSAKSPICKRQNAHNLIEKRYRNNLNTKINTLRDCIPSFRSAGKRGSEEDDDDDADSDAGDRRKVPGQKCNKGIILDKAIQYIAELEKEVQRLSKDNAALQVIVKPRIPNYLMLGLRG